MIAKKFVQTIVPTILHHSAKLSGPLLISDISSVYFFCAIALVLDRVFRSDSTTREVYEAGAKEVALSVVSGINCEYKHFFFCVLFLLLELHLDLIDKYSTKYFPASIFAYGQTSSGKTFTMSGITEYTMADIYDHIERVIKTPLYHPLSSLSVP